MSDADAIDFALLLLRSGVGAVMLAHGINHIRPNIDGTASWFGSMGMRPAKLHAWLASVTEIGAGIALLLGLLTPFAAAGVVGVMFVAWAINHRGNGFFIFRPGEGWEYVMTLGIVGLAIGAIGPGTWSLDEALGLNDDLIGWTGLLIAAIGGIGGGAALPRRVLASRQVVAPTSAPRRSDQRFGSGAERRAQVRGVVPAANHPAVADDDDVRDRRVVRSVEREVIGPGARSRERADDATVDDDGDDLIDMAIGDAADAPRTRVRKAWRGSAPGITSQRCSRCRAR